MDDKDAVASGELIECDLVTLMTPDGRIQYGRIVQIVGEHVIVCNHNWEQIEEQYHIESVAHGTWPDLSELSAMEEEGEEEGGDL